MDTEEKVEMIAEMAPEALLMDGFHDCIIGMCRRFGMDDVVLYSQEKVLERLMNQGMTHEEAMEYFEYNQIGAWMGEGTPAFAELFEEM
jgi:hypothetical protein